MLISQVWASKLQGGLSVMESTVLYHKTAPGQLLAGKERVPKASNNNCSKNKASPYVETLWGPWVFYEQMSVFQFKVKKQAMVWWTTDRALTQLICSSFAMILAFLFTVCLDYENISDTSHNVIEGVCFFLIIFPKDFGFHLNPKALASLSKISSIVSSTEQWLLMAQFAQPGQFAQ